MSCPICEKETVKEYRPFCSRRCADIDLGKWMTGAYAIPSANLEDDEELETELSKATDDGTTPIH
ncbi:MAG: DNA gyrase inhibitor YacG [Litoreibacter sp.]